MRRAHRIAALATVLWFSTVQSASARHWMWDWAGWFEEMSGPGPFNGVEVSFEVVCLDLVGRSVVKAAVLQDAIGNFATLPVESLPDGKAVVPLVNPAYAFRKALRDIQQINSGFREQTLRNILSQGYQPSYFEVTAALARSVEDSNAENTTEWSAYRDLVEAGDASPISVMKKASDVLGRLRGEQYRVANRALKEYLDEQKTVAVPNELDELAKKYAAAISSINALKDAWTAVSGNTNTRDAFATRYSIAARDLVGLDGNGSPKRVRTSSEHRFRTWGAVRSCSGAKGRIRADRETEADKNRKLVDKAAFAAAAQGEFVRSRRDLTTGLVFGFGDYKSIRNRLQPGDPTVGVRFVEVLGHVHLSPAVDLGAGLGISQFTPMSAPKFTRMHFVPVSIVVRPLGMFTDNRFATAFGFRIAGRYLKGPIRGSDFGGSDVDLNIGGELLWGRSIFVDLVSLLGRH